MEFSKEDKYFIRCLDFLPIQAVSADTSRMTLAYFGIAGLDLLNKLHLIAPTKKSVYVDWIYAQYINSARNDKDVARMGFRGAPFAGAPHQPHTEQSPVDNYDTAHLAMTYTAMCALIVLGDDLSRIDRNTIIQGMSSLQQSNGSFIPCLGSSEADMRFLFCACAISYILNDWRAVDQDKAISFILQSQSYDGGFGQGPMLESHGGSTYCAIASLYFMNRLDVLSSRQRQLAQLWCLQRQGDGFHGRINKPEDTCYAFWIGSSIEVNSHILQHSFTNEFVDSSLKWN